MNRSINSFLENDLVLKIISVLIGILIWFVVLDQQNPLSERTLSVPLRTNREILADKNMSMVSSTIPASIDVVIKGRKQRLEKVSSNDFQAFLDFGNISNTSQTTMNISFPQYSGDQEIIILDVYPKSVKISLEKIIRKEYPIGISWTGALPEGYEAINIKLNPNTVILQELESTMNSVDNVVVTVEYEQLLKGNSTNKQIEVYNQAGKVIPALDGSFQTSVGYELAKTVPVTTSVTGNPKEDYYVKDYTLSRNSVQIKGDYDVIKDISVIEAEQLDVDNVEASFQKELMLQIPEKVQLHNSNNTITAQVNIQRFSYKTVTIPKSSITIFGSDISGKTKYRIMEEEIIFTVKGPEEILNTVDTRSIKGFVSVSDTHEGSSVLDAEISLPSGLHIDDTVRVTVETEVVSLQEPTSPEATPAPVPSVTPAPLVSPTPSILEGI